MTVPFGKNECFYQEAKKNHQLEVSYQVIEMAASPFQWLSPGGKGDMLIDFSLVAPNGVPIKGDSQQREGSVVHTVVEDGTFTLCFDNSFGTYSTKLVNVEVYLFSTEDDDRWGGRFEHQDSYTYPPEVQSAESIANIQVFRTSQLRLIMNSNSLFFELQTSINKVRDDLIKITHSQDTRQAIERRDRNIAENNYDYVNRFSICSIFLMVAVGSLQVVLIRSLFEEKSVFKKVFKGLKGTD